MSDQAAQQVEAAQASDASGAPGAPATDERHEPGDLSHLAPRERRLLQQKLAKEALAKADAASVPIKTFTRSGKHVSVYDRHRHLEGLPAGWTLEQVSRHGKGLNRMCDNYWLEPGTEKRFDSKRKVLAYLDPQSEEAMIIASRQQDRLAYHGALPADDPDGEVGGDAKRRRLLGEGDNVGVVLDTIVQQVERLHSYRPPGRSTRNGPSAEEMARRAEASLAEGPSPFLAFALAHRHELKAVARDVELSVAEEVRLLTSKWRAATPATRVAFEALAAEERARVARSLKGKNTDRAQRLEDARARLLALLPPDEEE